MTVHDSVVEKCLRRDKAGNMLEHVEPDGGARVDRLADLAQHFVPRTPDLAANIAPQGRKVLVELFVAAGRGRPVGAAIEVFRCGDGVAYARGGEPKRGLMV